MAIQCLESTIEINHFLTQRVKNTDIEFTMIESSSVIDYPKLIKEQPYELLKKIRQVPDIESKKALRFILFLKIDAFSSKKKVADCVGLTERQGRNTWDIYKKGGIELILHRLQIQDKLKNHYSKISQTKSKLKQLRKEQTSKYAQKFLRLLLFLKKGSLSKKQQEIQKYLIIKQKIYGNTTKIMI